MPMLSRDQMYNKMGKPKFISLVHELSLGTDYCDPLFTVRDKKEGLISLRTLFIDLVAKDPSECLFAEEIFGDVQYWLDVREIKRLKEFLDQWREAAEVKRKSMAFQSMIKEVQENGKSAFSAAKYLIDEPWKGRTKTAKEQSKKTTDEAFYNYKDDVKRLKEEGKLQ